MSDESIILLYLIFLFGVLPAIMCYDEVFPKKLVNFINRRLKVKEVSK